MQCLVSSSPGEQPVLERKAPLTQTAVTTKRSKRRFDKDNPQNGRRLNSNEINKSEMLTPAIYRA